MPRLKAPIALGEGKVGLDCDCGTWTAESLRFLELDEDAADDVVMFFVLDRFKGVDSSSGLKSSSSSSS